MAVDHADSKIKDGTFYRLRDFVYIELHPSQPYKIGQIIGFKAGQNTNVLVKCRFYDRPRDIEGHWLKKLNAVSEKYMYTNDFLKNNFTPEMSPADKKRLVHQFKLRELIGNKVCSHDGEEGFVNASYIRGKCSIYRYIEVETIKDYISKEDVFFYLASFEDQPKHLALEGEVIISKSERLSKCVDIDAFLQKSEKKQDQLDAVIWDGIRSKISDNDFDYFLSLVRSVGLYARAFDQGRRIGDSSIQSALAYAFRDSTRYLAYSLLHSSNHDFNKAVSRLYIDKCPVICTDQLELWSEEDILYFYEEIRKSKKFYDIRKKNPNWKTVKQMVEFYYMNKVTETYMANKKERLHRKLSSVNQIYIPLSDSRVNTTLAVQREPGEKTVCEGCSAKQSTFWFPWNISKKYFLCLNCWIYWKKYGGLKDPHLDDGIKGFDSSYNCDICCIVFMSKHRFNRHMSIHYSYSCDFPNCHQKFSTPEKVALHRKYIHEYLPHTPDPSNVKNIFVFNATKSWKELRKQLCQYALYMKPICRKKAYSYEKSISNYEGKIPTLRHRSTSGKSISNCFAESRKRSTSSIGYVADSNSAEPPSKIVHS